jgi:hypothetical protein
LDTVLMANDSVIRGALQSCSAEAVVIRVGSEDTRLEPAAIKNVVVNGTVSCEWRGRLRSAPPIAVSGERGPGAAGLSLLSPGASAETSARGRWYGSETLAADGSAILLAIIAGAVASSSDLGSPGGRGRSVLPIGLGVLSAATYFAGAPIIHAFHQPDHDTSWKSVELRVGVPAAGALVGALVLFAAASSSGSSCHNGCFFNPGPGFYAAGGAILGFGVGMPVAMILDASLLAREQPITEVKSTMAVAPLILPKSNPASAQGGYGAALAGRF